MKQRYLFLAAVLALALLAGCAGSWKQPTPANNPPAPFTVSYTYPIDGMKEFPVTGSMIVHFNAPISSVDPEAAISLVEVGADGKTEAVPFHGTLDTATSQNLFVIPAIPLDPSSDFVLTVSSTIRGATGLTPAIPAGGLKISFSTLAANPQAGQVLRVTSVLPDPQVDKVFDFHTFRAYFSAPIDRRTVLNGDTFLFAGTDGKPVAGNLFVRSAQLVFDPDEDLAAGKYTMTITQGVLGVAGEKLAKDATFDYDVVSTQPRHQLTVENCPTLGTHSSCTPATSVDQLPAHPLTGDYTNSMLVDSLLLGPTRTYVSGQLTAELGSPGGDGSQIPMVIRKGQTLYATNIISTMGGEIPTGLQTGESKITVLTDAVGVLSDSALTTAVAGSPPSVSLTLDAAMSPADDAAGMLMGQIILGTRLYGTAQVDPATGKLVMNIAGYGEFFIFGERIRTQMSLTMQDATTIFPPKPDVDPPELSITSPLNGATRVRLGSAIYLLFNKTVLPSTVAQTVSVRTKQGVPAAVNVLSNGPKIILAPEEPLDPDTDYEIYVAPGLSDINGNKTTHPFFTTFRTGAVEWDTADGDGEPPIVTTTSPGEGARDIPPTVPGQLPVEVWFSQAMDSTTIVLGDSFRVVDRSAADAEVPGTLIYFGSRAAFYPNAPFVAGHNYRIILTDDIMSYGGIKISFARDHNAGTVKEKDIDFIAAERNRWVVLRLQLDPAVDVDGSGYIDNTETIPSPAVNFFKINSALIKEPSYAAGYMVSYVKGLAFDNNGQPYMDISLIPGISMTATSTQVSLRRLLESQLTDEEIDAYTPPNGLLEPLGRILIDMQQEGSAPAVESAEHLTQMNISMLNEINVDNPTMNSMMDHTIALTAVGDLSFSDDGLMVVAITGSTTMKMTIHIPIINIDLTLPLPTSVNMRAISRNPLSWWDAF
jgi:hypothetical protein